MEAAIVITMRVSDSVPVPEELGETHVMTCDRCGEPVYTTSTTYERLAADDIPLHEIVCNVCIVPDLKEAIASGNEEIIAADPELQKYADDNREDLLSWMIKRGPG